MRSTGSKIGHLRNEKTSSRNTIMVNYFRNSEIETILDPFETKDSFEIWSFRNRSLHDFQKKMILCYGYKCYPIRSISFLGIIAKYIDFLVV